MFIKFLLAILSILIIELIIEFVISKFKKGGKNEDIEEDNI